jgi:starvation-inducible DNA-binding protein
MSATSTPAHLPKLGHHERAEVGTQLQATLLELVDLSLVGKQLHWSVTGEHCRNLHLQLDELADSWRDIADVVAERAVAIGYWPDGQAAAVADAATAHAVERGAMADHTIVGYPTPRVAETAERVRERIGRLGELDVGSQDVLTAVLYALEEQLWMLRAQLPATK